MPNRRLISFVYLLVRVIFVVVLNISIHVGYRTQVLGTIQILHWQKIYHGSHRAVLD
jgi:hypothetical protein